MRYTIFCGFFCLFISCSPKEALVVREALVYVTIHEENLDIYQGDILGKWERKLTDNPGRDWYPQWNPGLKRLIYYSKDITGKFSVLSMDLDSKEILPLSNSDLADFKLSPDGERIIYTEIDGQNQHIWSCDLGGENRIQITKGESYNSDFSVSPDGNSLLFISNRSGSNELYIIDLITLATIQLTKNQMVEKYTTWSPDGSQIAFTMRTEEEGSKEDIYIMNANGSQMYQFTSTHYGEQEIAWSLSGKKIAFHGSTENDGDQIYTIDLADGKFTKITSGTDYRGEPAWIPIDN